MSWKDRATKVDATETKSSWKDRATPVQQEEVQMSADQEETPEESSFLDSLKSIGKTIISGKEEDLTPELQTDLADVQGKVESGLRGAGQGLSFGMADELSGAIESSAGSLGITDEDKTYEQARDESRANFKAAEEANPYTYKGSELFGSVLSGIGTGAGAVGTLGKLGAKGIGGLAAAEGALAGAGYSEGETAGEVAQDALTTGAFGGFLGGAAAKYGKNAVSKLATLPGAGAAAGAVYGYNQRPEDATTMETLESVGEGVLTGAAIGAGTKRLGKFMGVSDRVGANLKKGLVRGIQGKDVGTEELVQSAGETLEQSIKPVAKVQATQSRAAKKALDTAQDAVLTAEREVVDATNASERKVAISKLKEVSKKLTEKFPVWKKQFGQTIDKSYQEFEDQGLQFNTEGVFGQTLEEIDALVAKSPNDAQNSFLNTVRDTLEEFQVNSLTEGAGQSGSAIRGLKNTISNLVNQAPDSQTKRILVKSYQNLNNTISDQASEQGAREVADALRAANKNYSDTLLLDIITGAKPGRPMLAGQREASMTGILESLGSADRTARNSSNAAVITENLSKIDPEVAPFFTQAKTIAEDMKKLKTPSDKMLKRQTVEQLQELPSQLAPQQRAAIDLDQLTGKPMELTDSVLSSDKMIKYFKDEAIGDVERGKDIQPKLSQLMGEDVKPLEIAREAASELAFQKAAEGKPLRSAVPNFIFQFIAKAGGLGESLGIKGANMLGKNIAPAATITKSVSKSLMSALPKGTPAQLTQIAEGIMGSAPEAAKKILRMAETTDPIKRKAIIFMLSQDAQFKRTLDGPNEEETGAKDTASKEMTFEGAEVYGDWDK